MLTFDLEVRFYVTCLINKKDISLVEEQFDQLLKKLKFEITNISYKTLAELFFKGFDQLGYVEVVLKRFNDEKIDPTNLFHISEKIVNIATSLTIQHPESFYFDVNSPPYVLTAAMNTNKGHITWTKDNIEKYKKELGRWVEFYSGQWPDYSDDLYRSRVSNNLSNRLSEVHFIRPNSAFFYMPEEDFHSNFPYMETYFLKQILRVRSLLFCYSVLNTELDKMGKNISALKKATLKELTDSLTKIEELDANILVISSQIVSERLVNRRSHSQKVLNTCFELLGIEIAREETERKLEKLQRVISSRHEEAQRKLADQQKIFLVVLNALLGSQILFTIKDKVINIFNIPANDPVMGIVDPLIIIVMTIIIVFATAGLIYTWLVKHIKIKIGKK